MAKQGLSYYQAETDRFQDIKIKRLKKKYGCEGYAVYTYIENEIYRNNGCFIKATDDIIFDIAEYWAIDEEQVETIINFCTDIDIFDSITWKSRQVLTSEHIQQKYVSVCKHAHKAIILPEEIRLIDIQTEQVRRPVTLPLFSEDNQPEPATGTPHYGQPQLLEHDITAQPVAACKPTTGTQVCETEESRTYTTNSIPQNSDFANIRETSRKTRTESDKRKENKTNSSSIPLTNHVPSLKEEAEKLLSSLQRGQLAASQSPKPENEDEKAPKRNETGLLQQLGQLNIPPHQMRDICRLCRYGEIGHPVWTLFDDIRRSRGRITMPGLFIISRLKQLRQPAGTDQKAV